MPEISVIIPALNEQKYIGNPLGGLKSQTFKDFETIVVDGGSKDRTVSIARKSAKVIVCREKGVSAARNRGAAAVRIYILECIQFTYIVYKGNAHENGGLICTGEEGFEGAGG